MDESGAIVPRTPAAKQQNDAITPAKRDSVDSVSRVEWAACYLAEMPYLIRYLQKAFGSSDIDDATDAAHSAFAELFTKWDTVHNPRAWLRTVAFRKMLQRSAQREEPLDTLPPQLIVPSSSEQLELREQERELIAVLRELPRAQRQVLALMSDNFSYSEIAEIMRIRESAVRKNAERARARMKKLLGLSG